ncbi:YHYH protein [candidate division WWE3 bacterium]|uniref:YHYH protein n=1 Tax=candidate division WWE3 bacterium TaxID=2053526 RepID=A0A955LHD8_UNCKA|nr:YHYH protein [candidate division WWE3 bacterium]
MNQRGFAHVAILLFIVMIGVGIGVIVLLQKDTLPYQSEISTEPTPTTISESPPTPTEVMAHEDQDSDEVVYHTVDTTALPLGDDKYASSPQKGYVYTCMNTFNGGGAFTQGPWIDTQTNTWDLTQKVSVDGTVSWPNASWSISSDGTTRTLAGNDLPTYHTTGTYPISSTDDAYNYDRNPNAISKQSLSLSLPTNPTIAANPQCVGGEVGIMLSGVLIFSAFDAGGRDAVATEVQDSCQGHPQESGYYHYHGWSSCLQDDHAEGEHSDLVGYAFDGFGIYGLKGEQGVEISSEDLDECHGHTHFIEWDGISKEMYHYHMTQDFPYSVSCFKGEPVTKALSSNQSGQGPGNNLPPNGPPPPPR